MIKQIKKYGETFIVSFSKEERELYKIHLGDMVEIFTFKGKPSLNRPQTSSKPLLQSGAGLIADVNEAAMDTYGYVKDKKHEAAADKKFEKEKEK